MLLEHPALEPFEPLLRGLHPLIFRYGVDSLEKEGLLRNGEQLLAVIDRDKAARRRFMRGCHYGYDLAQRKIGAAVLGYEARARALSRNLKESRRERDAEGVKSRTAILKCLRNRQLVLRRLVDALLNLMVQGNTWVLRHAFVETRIHDIDPVVLAGTLDVAARLNAEDRMSFHLVSDLSTVIHVGDLVRIGLEGASPGLTIIELKEGALNETLSEIVDISRGRLSDQQLQDINAHFGEKAASQVRRMARQQVRAEEFSKLVNTDEGIDILHQRPVRLIPEAVCVRDYSEPLRAICSVASQEGTAAVVVDKALRLIAADRSMTRQLGQRGIADAFFRLRHPAPERQLLDEQRRAEKLDGVSNAWPFFDLAEMNHYSMWPRPMFLWPMQLEQIFDLVFGRVRVFAQLDFDVLFELAKTHGIEVRWLTSKESAKVGRLSSKIPGSPGAAGVLARLSDGRTCREQQLLVGFFGRIFLELMSPSQLIELMERNFKQCEAGSDS